MEEPFSSKAAELHCFTAGYTAKSLLYLERLSLMGITFSFQKQSSDGHLHSVVESWSGAQ